MKKTLLLIIASLGFAIIGLKAQPCTPDPNCIDIEDPGQICPLAFDTAYVNTAYEQVITFIPPSVFNYNGNNVEVQKIVIDNVTDLPEGITWAADAQEFIPTVPETKYCAVIYGTPTTEGVFPFHLSASVTVLLGGYVPIPIPVTEETLDYTPILVVRPENEAPPVAEFTAETTTADINESITFTDLSYNATSWIWNFEGADQE
ncbi:MAG: hypothetical protein GX879_10495, partial [Bacteroidales bacterium]|nr:hypothetical protein [Bacteroidales bacterium]